MATQSKRTRVKISILKLFGKRLDISDPILPSNGLPLPAIVGRRRSIPPVLPDFSRLSLLPNFTSSQYRIKSSDFKSALAEGSDHNTQPLLVRYSLLDLKESNKQETSSASTRTIRKVQGRQELRDRGAEDTASDVSSYIEKYIDSTPNHSSPVGPSDSPLSDIFKELIKPTRGDSLPMEPNNVEKHARIPMLEHLENQTDYLLESFCILDLQLPGHPVSVISEDLLPENGMPEDFCLFLKDDDNTKPWKIEKFSTTEGQSYHLLLNGELVEQHSSTTHKFVGQVDITQIIDRRNNDYDAGDIFLTIAHEEMIKEEIPLRSKGRYSPLAPLTKYPPREVELIKSLYESYFILGPSALMNPEYMVTHLSPSLTDKFPTNCLTFRDAWPKQANAVYDHLARGKKFVWKIEEQSENRGHWVCFVPMFGPQLSSWLCFLIDESSLYDQYVDLAIEASSDTLHYNLEKDENRSEVLRPEQVSEINRDEIYSEAEKDGPGSDHDAHPKADGRGYEAEIDEQLSEPQKLEPGPKVTEERGARRGLFDVSWDRED
ncbi:hypothetical protein MMC06_004008 [Schaereria dolodes]|nr:hypothetical protein [Schaereria dolodes]